MYISEFELIFLIFCGLEQIVIFFKVNISLNI